MELHRTINSSAFLCDICDAQFSDRINLTKHYKRRHVEPLKRADDGYKTCHICQQQVPKDDFNDHKATCNVSQSSNPDLRCANPHCGYISAVATSIRRHMKK